MRSWMVRTGVLVMAGLLPFLGPAADAAPGLSGATAAQSFGPAVTVHNAYGRCLDADVSHIGENGDVVQLWSCSGSPQQIWYGSSDNAIHVGYNGRCLDADVNHIFENGARVQLWDCNGSAQQRWLVSRPFSESTYSTIRTLYNGKCLDADLNTIGRDGTVMQLWDCNFQLQQLWWFD
jgi:hypothetical protein